MKTTQNGNARLNLKIAKSIANAEFGTSRGLSADKRNSPCFRRYEMSIGKHIITVKNVRDEPNLAYVEFGRERVFYNIATMTIDYAKTETARNEKYWESCIDTMTFNKSTVFKKLIEIYGLEDCCNTLNGLT